MKTNSSNESINNTNGYNNDTVNRNKALFFAHTFIADESINAIHQTVLVTLNTISRNVAFTKYLKTQIQITKTLNKR